MGFPIPVFKTGALVRSAIPPFRRILTYISVEDKQALESLFHENLLLSRHKISGSLPYFSRLIGSGFLGSRICAESGFWIFSQTAPGITGDT